MKKKGLVVAKKQPAAAVEPVVTKTAEEQKKENVEAASATAGTLDYKEIFGTD